MRGRSCISRAASISADSSWTYARRTDARRADSISTDDGREGEARLLRPRANSLSQRLGGAALRAGATRAKKG